MKKKIIGILALLVLTACGGSETPKKEVSDTKGSKEKKEMTIFLHSMNRIVYKTDWPVAKELEKATGVTLKGVAPESATNTKEAFNLMMVSGDLPDIVQYEETLTDVNKYGMQGAFMPLNDLIDKYAPDIKKAVIDNPDIKRFITAPDGKIYGIPYVVADLKTAQGWMIRQDWLDKLGLKTPTTVDELHDVLVAFRDRDPNGNGLKDEIPFMSRNRSGWEMLKLVNLFGSRMSGSERTFIDFYEKDGKVRHAWVEPEFKYGVQQVAKWYKEKLIDPEVFTRGGKGREVLFGANQAGMTRDWFASTLALNGLFKEKIPGFNLVSIAPPKDVNGKQWDESRRAKVQASGWAISAKNKDPKRTIEYMNYVFTPEGSRMVNFGVEGTDYIMKDGKPVFTDKVLKNTMAPVDYLRSIGAQIQIGFKQDADYERGMTTPDVIKAMNDYEQYIIDDFTRGALSVEEQKVYDKNWPAISNYMQERVQKWILGSEELNDKTWDDYLAKLNSMGFQEVMKVMQAAQERAEKK